MPKGPQEQHRPADVVGAAVKMAKIATGELSEEPLSPATAGRILGRQGGKDRAAKLSAQQRTAIAKRAAIDGTAERALNGFQIRLAAIGRKLDTMRESPRYILHERRLPISPAHEVGDNQLTVGVNDRPGPHIPRVLRAALARATFSCLA